MLSFASLHLKVNETDTAGFDGHWLYLDLQCWENQNLEKGGNEQNHVYF